MANTFDGVLTGGQPNRSEIQELKEEGVTKFINLRDKGEFPDPEAFGEEVRSFGIDYVWFPISKEEDFTKDKAQKLVDEIQAGSHQKVLVHCASSNRVGALFAIHSYFNEGKSKEESLQIGVKAGLSGMKNFVDSLLS